MTRRRAGFTLVELMVVATIIGILARIALPKYQRIRLKAQAAAMVSELNVIRGAAYTAFEDKAAWPLDVATGKIPPEMSKLLPGSLSFAPMKGVTYDWLLSGMPQGNPSKATKAATMGMGINTTDLVLRAEVQRQLSKQPTIVSGGIVYWLIWSPTVKP